MINPFYFIFLEIFSIILLYLMVMQFYFHTQILINHFLPIFDLNFTLLIIIAIVGYYPQTFLFFIFIISFSFFRFLKRLYYYINVGI